ncbi:MAG TPA: TonB family protein [Steroidobacteraceae bacterium]|nr:TonB family protein [Steroidobacteraceae bacterium]
MFASAPAPVAIAALTQDRALIGLLRSVVDPATDLILVSSEAELTPHLNSRRVSVALLDSMFIEGDLGALSERLRDTWNDLVLVVVGTAEEQGKVASQITSGVVYRFLHRPVSAPRVRLFVEAALRRHEVENVERTLETARPDFSRLEAPKAEAPRKPGSGSSLRLAIVGAVLVAAAAGAWFAFPGGKSSGPVAGTEVVSPPAAEASGDGAADPEPAPARDGIEESPPVAASPVSQPRDEPAAPAPAPVQAEAPRAAAPEPAPATTADTASQRMQRTVEDPVESPATAAPPPPPVQTREQLLQEKLTLAESALQRGELASPPGKSAVDLFRGALELDPGNTLAKAGLVRVADRLLAAAERALTGGNPEDARKMVDVAEQLTPATARGAFLMMQIEKERERAALTAKRDNDAQDQQEKGAAYLRLAGVRLRSGALIDPPEDNARFYLEAARQTVPDDPGVAEMSRSLQKELLTRAGAAASAGNAAETERWLANADAMGAARADLATTRRLLQDTLIGARAGQISELVQAFNGALNANKLLTPADASAKHYLLALIETDSATPAVATARQGLGAAYLREMRGALARGDVAAADAWLLEGRTISYSSSELNAAETELAALRAKAAQRASIVGANSLARIEYVAPKFPVSTRNRNISGWVELEFTVRTDGSTGDIVVTNSNPRRTFDSAAVAAIAQWRYKPVMLDGKAVDQRASVRIRFLEE